MPPKRTLAAAQRPAIGRPSASVHKNTTATASSKTRAARSLDTSIINLPPFRRATRSSTQIAQAQEIPHPSSPALEPLPTKPVEPASTASESPIEPLQHTRTKRRRESEEEGSGKRRRKGPEPKVKPAPSTTPLIRENLEKLNSETASKISDMGEGRKRSLSRPSSNTDLNQDTASVTSQKSSLSLSDYRFLSLDRARIVVQHRDPPEHIQSRVNAIIQPEIPGDRKSVLFSIADDLCDAFPDILEGASREDDCVELIHRALEAMNSKLFDKVFALRRKADWEPTLKPSAQRKSYCFDSVDKSLNDASDSFGRPTKRQQPETSYISPERSENNMRPPPLPPKQDTSSVKTPRPDITGGFLHSVVAKKLKTLGVEEPDADEILKDLQFERKLFSSPTQPAFLVRFPSMVVEGKSYGTGKSMYEAENQAAVSGSCMLVIQQQLAELTERCAPSSRQSKEPLAFSICHEGPIIHLWSHYTTKVRDARFYNSRLLAYSHPILRPTVRDFFIALLGVMEWASTELLDDIAAQLVLVWKAAQ